MNCKQIVNASMSENLLIYSKFVKKGKQKNSLKNINEVLENYFLFLNYFNNFEQF